MQKLKTKGKGQRYSCIAERSAPRREMQHATAPRHLGYMVVMGWESEAVRVAEADRTIEPKESWSQDSSQRVITQAALKSNACDR